LSFLLTARAARLTFFFWCPNLRCARLILALQEFHLDFFKQEERFYPRKVINIRAPLCPPRWPPSSTPPASKIEFLLIFRQVISLFPPLFGSIFSRPWTLKNVRTFPLFVESGSALLSSLVPTIHLLFLDFMHKRAPEAGRLLLHPGRLLFPLSASQGSPRCRPCG